MPTPGADTALLGHAQVGSDADPDDDERGEDPEQERRLADGQPRQVFALEEESNPSGATGSNVQLDNLTAYRCGGVARRLPFSVAIDNSPVGKSRTSHRPSLALGARYAFDPRRSFT